MKDEKRLKDSFHCTHLRGDGRCKRSGRLCSAQCQSRLKCEECEFSNLPPSQEPCAECFFLTKETMRQYILSGTHR